MRPHPFRRAALMLLLSGSSVSALLAAQPAPAPDVAATTREAAETLKQNPADGAANLALGRYLCFDRGRWDKGLPLLAKGSDEALRDLARRDGRVADAPIARVVMGHDWWDWGSAQKDDDVARVRAHERAAAWYERALPEARGEQRDRLLDRVRQADTDADALYAKLGVARPVDADRIEAHRAAIDAADTTPLAAEEIKKPRTFTAGDLPFALAGALTVTAGDPIAIEFAAGVEIRGGTIDLGQRGSAIIKGTATRPVVFRNVQFLQDLGAGLTAQHAVFDHCTFAKGGWWFSEFSSHWVMSDCVLYGCTFPKLTRVDYGFQFHRCALVAMTIPEIQHDRPADFDHMTRLRTGWNTIESCDFAGCTIPPTVAWCAVDSNFTGCTFVPGEAFDSAKPLTASLYVADTVGDGPQAVWDQNPPRREKVTFAPAEKPFDTTHFTGGSGVPELRYEGGRVRLLVDREATGERGDGHQPDAVNDPAEQSAPAVTPLPPPAGPMVKPSDE